MKVAFLGAGMWGYCLASLLASKGINIYSWTRDPKLARQLDDTGKHPHLQPGRYSGKIQVSTDLAEVLDGADVIVESVTSKGIRPVFEQVAQLAYPNCPIV